MVYVWGMKKIRTNIQLSEQHRRYLIAQAKRYGISMSEYMRRLIDGDRGNASPTRLGDETE